jgi:hypothetical protein
MLRIIKSLFQQLTSGRKRSAGSVPSRRPQRRSILAVEALEERVVLSTTPLVQAAGGTALTGAVAATGSTGSVVAPVALNPLASFTLQQNNLYETVGTTQTLIDTNVQAFATCPFAGSRSLFDLSTGGQVREYNGTGTNWTAVTGNNTHATALVALVLPAEANGGLYILAANNGAVTQTVWQYSGSGTNWIAVTGSNTNATALAVAINGLFMLDSTLTVWRYNGVGTSWTAVTGSNTTASALVAADGGLFMLGTNNGAANQNVWQYLNSGTNWANVTPSNINATTLVGADGGLYVVGITTGVTDGQVWQYAGSGTNWNDVNGNFSPTALVAADGGLFALDNYGQGVFQYNGSGYQWTQVTQNVSPTALVAADGGLFMLAPVEFGSTGTVWQYSGSGTFWNAEFGSNVNSTALVAADGGLFMLASKGAANETVFQWSGSGTSWTAVTGSSFNATALVAANAGLFMLGNSSPGNENVWQYGGGVTWTATFAPNINATTLVAADGSLDTLIQEGTVSAVWQLNRFGNWSGLTANSLSVSALVTDDGGLFMLAGTTGGAVETVWQYAGPNSNWTAVTNPSNMNASTLVATDGGLFMLASAAGAPEQVWRYTGAGTNWITVANMPGQAIISPVNSGTWSGYVVAPTSNVTAVGGTWIEPTVGNSGLQATWVGIDGASDGTVEQIGVGSMPDGTSYNQYAPWIEFYGDQGVALVGGKYETIQGQYYLPQQIPLTVSPGDTVSAEVATVPGNARSFEFWMTVTPKNGGAVQIYHSIQTMTYVTPTLTSAEWIVENPGFGVKPLASFTPVTFTGAWATIGGQTGGINSFPKAQAWNMSSNEATDFTTNPPINSNTPGYNEAGRGLSSSIFQVNWAITLLGTGGGSGGSGLGGGGLGGGGGTLPNSVPVTPVAGLGQGTGTAPLAFLSAPIAQPAPADEGVSTLGVRSHEGLGGSNGQRSTAAVDAVFAQDALDNRLGSTTVLDGLFALDALGRHHHRDKLI